MVTQEILKKLLNYDEETGIFTNRIARGTNAKAGAVAGSRQPSGYLAINIGGTPTRCHRLAWLYVYGEFPDSGIDHINHDRADNRIVNLRLASAQENARNARMRRVNASGFTGVYFNKATGKWRAQIIDRKKCIYIGEFDEILDAAAARKAKEAELGFHENHGL